MTPEYLTAWQSARGLSDVGVARYLGVSRASWIRWRTGVHAPPPWLAGLMYAYDRGWRAAA
jgi:transcriptional regulator with XRE-family HTH domain